jgi:hypothetical protein
MRRPNDADTVELRARIGELVAGASRGVVKRLHTKLEGQLSKKRAGHANPCRPQARPLDAWRPKRAAESRAALVIIQEGVGVRSAPFAVGDGVWQHKFFNAEVAIRLRQKEDDRAATSTASLVVGTIAARVVDVARKLRAEDASFAAAEIDMQTFGKDAGWDKTRTRGSGIVFNDDGRRLFDAAVASVRPTW